MSHLRAVTGGDAGLPQRSGLATQVRAEAPGRVTLSLGRTAPGTEPQGGSTSVLQAVRLIETVTARRQSLDAHGTITLCPAEDGAPQDEAHALAARAAGFLAEETGVVEGVDLLLRRRVPAGCGLGAAAAAAAATLLACNALWGTGLAPDALATLAARLDPDVPFALAGATAVDHGTGEHLSPLMTRGSYQWVIACSDEGLTAPEVLARHGELTSRAPRPPQAPQEDLAVLTAALRAGDAAALAPTLRNDLEPAVLDLRPALREVIALAEEAGALRALVAGTGPTVACLVPDSGTAMRVSRTLAASGLVACALRADAPVAGARTVG